MRTLTEIKDSIKANFIANSTLIDLYSLDTEKPFDEQFSSVSIESIIIFIVSVAIWAFESVLTAHETDIEHTIALQAVCSIPWYYSLCLSFQLGYDLFFNPSTYSFEYSTTDTDAQIIQFAAVRQLEAGGVTILRIYVSKTNKVALSSSELSAFAAYIRQRGAAGVHYEIVSQEPTSLAFTIQITRNAMVLDSEGQLLSDNITKPVETAIASYLDGIEYGAIFNRTKLVDAIQNATGVNDVILMEVRVGTEIVSSQNIEAPGGAFAFDSATSVITYAV